MAQPVNVGDTVVVTIVSGWGDDAFNRLAYEITALGAGTPTDLTFVSAFDVAINTDWKAILANNVAYRGCFATLHAFGDPTPFIRQVATGNAGVGTFGTDMIAAQVAGLIKWKTPRAGRKERGRMYVPGVAKSAVDTTEHPTTAYKTALDTVATDIIGFTSASFAGTSCSCRLCLRNKVGTLTTITDFEISPKWATQKRRGDYGRQSLGPL